MGKRTDWEVIRPLGEGGQSEVFLVRSPQRCLQRNMALDHIRPALDGDKRAQLASAIWIYARPDSPSELAALKLFKIEPDRANALSPPPDSDAYQAIQRLSNEVAALNQERPGLPKMLDSNIAERWVVTEFFPNGTLEDSPSKYRGNPVLALKAFRSLVNTVKSLHQDGYVHRDIKPANVFIRTDFELVLGDFGIAYAPSVAQRLTQTGERVGPRDHMPPWAHLGVRHEKVEPCFDIYMLGKLLWSMVDGRAVLPREYYNNPELDFDLTKTFPDEPHMHLINIILEKCVVERASQCLSSAEDLLIIVDTMLRITERGGQILAAGVPRPCHVCGNGHYHPEKFRDHTSGAAIRFWFSGVGSGTESLNVQPYTCDSCGHVELFKAPPS